jgi:hypothetical protein
VIVAGIDPGTSGAVAFIDLPRSLLTVIDMPLEAGTKGRNLTSATGLHAIFATVVPTHVWCEHVGTLPSDGVVGAFSFGRAFGRIEGAASAFCKTDLVRPIVWKNRLSVPADKTKAVARAAHFFPAAQSAGAFHGPRGGLKDGRAEAALIALYGCMALAVVPTQLQYVEFADAFPS